MASGQDMDQAYSRPPVPHTGPCKEPTTRRNSIHIVLIAEILAVSKTTKQTSRYQKKKCIWESVCSDCKPDSFCLYINTP